MWGLDFCKIRCGDIMRHSSKPHIIALMTVFLGVGTANASPLVFQGQNAGLFPTANPNDTTSLMSSVVRPNQVNNSSATPLTAAYVTEQAVLSQAANNVVSAIFGGSAPVGILQTIPIGGGEYITYINNGNGTVTVNLPNGGGSFTVNNNS